MMGRPSGSRTHKKVGDGGPHVASLPTLTTDGTTGNARKQRIDHVLMTADTVGGVWTYAVELARALRPHGVSMTLAAIGRGPSADQRRQLESLASVQVFEGDFALEWMNDPWDEVDAAGEWLLHLEALVQPDIVHLNGYAHGALPWNAPALIVGHSCVFSWFEAVRRQAPPPEWEEYRQRVASGLRAAAGVTAPTFAMLENLRRYYGEFVDLHPIPHARESRLLRPGAKEEIILTAGRLWDEAKNISALSRAASRVSWPIIAAGPREHSEGGIAELAGIATTGLLQAEELAALYGRAAIFALPARYEPFGLAALEAGLAGCALVLGDIASLREVWGDAALFVPPDDDDRLQDALQTLIHSPRLLAEYQQRAGERALEYTPEKMAEMYMKAYATVLTRWSQPGRAMAAGEAARELA